MPREGGARTDHVADILVLSTETVRSHIKNITRKLGVHIARTRSPPGQLLFGRRPPV